MTTQKMKSGRKNISRFLFINQQSANQKFLIALKMLVQGQETKETGRLRPLTDSEHTHLFFRKKKSECIYHSLRPVPTTKPAHNF
jgi:hypothetical protein